MIFYYPPSAPMTRAIRKRLRQRGLRYRIGHLGELMEENLTSARRHGTLRYRPEHLRLLRTVDENPDVVDVAFEVLAERLDADGIAMPTSYDERIPADPDYVRIGLAAAALAVAMTVLISAAVVIVSNIATMTTLVVLISVLGAALFIQAITRLVVPVEVPDEVARGDGDRPGQ